MFPRHFFSFCALMMVIAIASASANEEVVKDDDAEQRNPLLAVAVRVLGQAFKWAAKNCLEEGANNCRQHWKNPKELIKCGGAFLKANKGRCVVG